MDKIMAKLNIKSPLLFKVLLGVAGLAVLVLGVVYISLQQNAPVLLIADDEPAIDQEYMQMAYITPAPIPIVVYISGHVYYPGVFEFYQGARVRDAVQAAGGLTSYADPNAINLAATLFDEQHIVVFGLDDGMPPSSSALAGQSGGGLININRATAEELTNLSGIGPARADAIIRHREARGGFAAIEEIMNVSGIGDSIFENIRNQIRVD
ncbi:MAG: helix-hairpin-helix domain-containing protein [Defluviitaleaceae bacterium]|nr:helix-hairpin-helix domain-containing protein [Defluviitaleaceae bacterium]